MARFSTAAAAAGDAAVSLYQHSQGAGLD
jgi:hypothetical protein